MSFLFDSGSNVHMTPHLYDLWERKSISKKFTHGKKLQLQATASDVIKLLVQEKGKAVELNEYQERLVGARTTTPSIGHRIHQATWRGACRLHTRKSHIIFREVGPKIELDERKGEQL